MTYVKDFLVSLFIVVMLLLATAFDPGYEDAKLSAQVLDEAKAQAYADEQTVKHELVASTSIK